MNTTTTTSNDFLAQPITEKEGIARLIEGLASNDWLYHLDDDPAQIIWASEKKPSDAEISLMKERVNECLSLDEVTTWEIAAAAFTEMNEDANG